MAFVTHSQIFTALQEPLATAERIDYKKRMNFESFYRSQWGERWPQLEACLHQKEKQVARKNIFSDVSVDSLSGFDSIPVQNCFEVTNEIRQEIPRGPEGLLGFYIQDPASVWIAEQLQTQPGDFVLDACAAPGGKSLVLVEALKDAGELISNEPSQNRRDRLIKVIQNYVPRQVRDRVRVTGKDAALFSKSHANQFDRVLLDAPCSGERHLVENQKQMQDWSPRRSEKLSLLQYSLLCGALEALKPGGTLVYSTCSLSKLENQDVLAKFLKKKGDRIRLDEMQMPPGAERNEFGVLFLPDRCGFGPLFAARFQKI